MDDGLGRALRDIAEHKYLSVQLGHPRAIAMAKALLECREWLKAGEENRCSDNDMLAHVDNILAKVLQ